MAEADIPDHEAKKGSAELIILALLEDRVRHGYEISRLVEQRSAGALRFNAASLYPILYRLEAEGKIRGRWVERAGERRRRFYRLTAGGRQALAQRRREWLAFVRALDRVARLSHA